MEIGRIIARLRKEQHLTQEQLGQAVGVSAQAISKWENGGAPDAELLPCIADRLGVTIDTLFGREQRETEDMCDSLYRWLAAKPSEKRLWELFSLLAQSFYRPHITDHQALTELLGNLLHSQFPSKSCYTAESSQSGNTVGWLRSCMVLPQGLQLGILSEDCPMYLLMPEPEAGYASNFADSDQYRQLFTALSLPGTLEILHYLYGKHTVYFSLDAIQKAVPLSPAEVQAAIHAMENAHLISSSEVELENGTIPVYILHDSEAYVPFMLFARWFSEKQDFFFTRWVDRKAPILSKTEVSHETNQ